MNEEAHYEGSSRTPDSGRLGAIPKERLKDYPIHIQFGDVGCSVNVGCRVLHFSDVNEFLDEFNLYVLKPQETIEKWNKKFNQS